MKKTKKHHLLVDVPLDLRERFKRHCQENLHTTVRWRVITLMEQDLKKHVPAKG
jgi:hypothetical protein